MFTAAPPSRVLLGLRHSPDWRSLAEDAAAGRPIAPQRYRPPPGIPGFPDDLPGLIALWNDLFQIGFFECRAALREIAARTLAQVRAGEVIDAQAIEQRAGEIRRSDDFLLFFLDDDDWFAPDTLDRLGGIAGGNEDVVVFPLPRLSPDTFTFVRGVPSGPVPGRASPFATRYHTNNYGLRPHLCRPQHVRAMREHELAGRHADRMGLRDRYSDVIVSATSKTPVSASLLPRLRDDPGAARDSVRRYVDHLAGLPLPDGSSWLAAPIAATAALFTRAAA